VSEKGRTYECKTCRREITRAEVVNCEICLKKQCPNCIVEIAGKKMCPSCKEWALGKLEAGEKLEIDESFFKDVVSHKKKMREGLEDRIREVASDASERPVRAKSRQPSAVKKTIGSVFLVIGGIIILILMFAWTEGGTPFSGGILELLPFAILGTGILIIISDHLQRKRHINWLQVDADGIIASRRNSSVEISWSEVRGVLLEPGASLVSYGRKKKLLIKNRYFPSYGAIAMKIKKICKEKGVVVRE